MVHDSGVVEHLSRRARYSLFLLVYNKLIEKLCDERSTSKQSKGRPPINEYVASNLHVSVGTIKIWLTGGEIQACDKNARIVLRKAVGLDKEGTTKILEEDLREHFYRLRSFLEPETIG